MCKKFLEHSWKGGNDSKENYYFDQCNCFAAVGSARSP